MRKAVMRGAVIASAFAAAACGHSQPSALATGSCPFTPPTGPLESYCGKTSWVSGTTELCSGHLVYHDYLYDDYGADGTVPTIRWEPNSSNASVTPTGDDTYPTGDENTGDIVNFEMWLDGDQVQVKFQLNTLYRADQTAGIVAIDTDNNPATGGGTWPGFNTASQGWDEIHVFSQGDLVTNQITGHFPRPSGNGWKVWAALAQTTNGKVMNVAFRGMQETTGGNWFDQKQATALMNGDVSAFSAEVCPADLAAGTTRGTPVVPGFHERVYTSNYVVTSSDSAAPQNEKDGEGISVKGITGPKVQLSSTDPRVYQSFNFLGRYQPYAYYLPSGLPAGVKPAMQVILHGFSQTQDSAAGNAGSQAAFGDALHRIIVAPLGRGLAGAYSYSSERDVLDVVDDAINYFDIDQSKIVMSGVSMGGYGQLAMGTLYPDRWAGMVGWVSPTGDFETYPNNEPPTYYAASLVANTARLVRNLRNVPVVLRYGEEDEFVLKVESDKMLDYMTGNVAGEQPDAGVFDFDKVANGDHLSTMGSDQTLEAALSTDWQRPAHVARVTYRMDPGLDVPEFAIKHDRAYWVSALVSRDGTSYADVDLTSNGRGLPVPTTLDGSSTGTGPGQLIWTRNFRHVASLTPSAAANRLSGTVANVSSLSVDMAAACLSSAAVSYHIETDGPALINLSDGRQISLPAAGTYDGTI